MFHSARSYSVCSDRLLDTGFSPKKDVATAIRDVAAAYRDGRIKGTLGGGCLEAEIQQRAIQSLRTGESATFDLLLDHDFGLAHLNSSRLSPAGPRAGARPLISGACSAGGARRSDAGRSG